MKKIITFGAVAIIFALIVNVGTIRAQAAEKYEICHISDGAPIALGDGNWFVIVGHTVKVSYTAASQHLSHGDFISGPSHAMRNAWVDWFTGLGLDLNGVDCASLTLDYQG